MENYGVERRHQDAGEKRDLNYSESTVCANSYSSLAHIKSGSDVGWNWAIVHLNATCDFCVALLLLFWNVCLSRLNTNECDCDSVFVHMIL